MNKEAQRIAIAELCRFTGIHVFTTYDGDSHLMGNLGGGEGNAVQKVPDYLGNLNAIQEAKKTLLTTRKLKLDFRDDLMSIIQRDGPMELGTTWLAIMEMCLADCQQQAEALIKALNKWEEAE